MKEDIKVSESRQASSQYPSGTTALFSNIHKSYSSRYVWKSASVDFHRVVIISPLAVWETPETCKIVWPCEIVRWESFTALISSLVSNCMPAAKISACSRLNRR
jgi:hypothetical protein